jgi:hypothetical protein
LEVAVAGILSLVLGCIKCFKPGRWHTRLPGERL